MDNAGETEQSTVKHSKDSDCTVEGGVCVVCKVSHAAEGEGCHVCDGRGFHVDGCAEAG